MLKIKKGVSLLGISNPMLVGIQIVASVYEKAGYDCVITSATEDPEVHGRASRHKSGNAADFRTNNVPKAEHKWIETKCRECLGNNYDVVLEVDHLHVEYDPK